MREEVKAGTPLFRLDSSEQQAAAESAGRRIIEVDAALDVARIGLQVAEGRIAEARGAYDQALEEYETRARLFERNPDAIPERDVEKAKTLAEARKGALDAAIATKTSTEAEVNTLLPAQKASAQAELEEAAAELAKTTVYAGVTGRLEQFTLRPGDLVNPIMCPAGILIPSEARRIGLQAGLNRIEAQVIRRGMIGEAACSTVPFQIIPLVVTEVQSVIAAGQLRPTDQLVDPMQVPRAGAITAYLEPLFEDGISALPRVAAARSTSTPATTQSCSRPMSAPLSASPCTWSTRSAWCTRPSCGSRPSCCPYGPSSSRAAIDRSPARMGKTPRRRDRRDDEFPGGRGRGSCAGSASAGRGDQELNLATTDYAAPTDAADATGHSG